MAKKRDWGETLYSGEATFGRINAVIGAVVATFIGIILVVVGIFLMFHKSHLKKIRGEAARNSQCNQSQTCDSKGSCHTTYACTTPVKYTVGGKDYRENLSTGSTSYETGDEVTFYYNPSDPTAIESAPAPPWIGWAMIALALVVVFSSWAWVYVTRKSKVAAAVGGTAATVGAIRGALR